MVLSEDLLAALARGKESEDVESVLMKFGNVVRLLMRDEVEYEDGLKMFPTIWDALMKRKAKDELYAPYKRTFHRFGALPAELRCRIYEEYFCDNFQTLACTT